MKELGFLAARVGTLLAQHTVLRKQVAICGFRSTSVSSDPAIKNYKTEIQTYHDNENEASYLANYRVHISYSYLSMKQHPQRLCRSLGLGDYSFDARLCLRQ